MPNNYDSIELKLLSVSSCAMESLTEAKRILLACTKSKNIKPESINTATKNFMRVSKDVHELCGHEMFLFYRKYNFFKAGVRVNFLN